jgi:hypothetical protein
MSEKRNIRRKTGERHKTTLSQYKEQAEEAQIEAMNYAMDLTFGYRGDRFNGPEVAPYHDPYTDGFRPFLLEDALSEKTKDNLRKHF